MKINRKKFTNSSKKGILIIKKMCNLMFEMIPFCCLKGLEIVFLKECMGNRIALSDILLLLKSFITLPCRNKSNCLLHFTIPL